MSEGAVEIGAGLRRSNRRSLVGVVKAAVSAKTIQVLVTREFKHPKYEKRVRRSKKYAVHDEKGEARMGDAVEIMEARRFSKTKNWRLVGVLKRGE
ncbi:MAG: 30S ribosomal protein S17 [Planctomycetota bacterium]|jgi:small subunit ribosomal protein S17|nr:30S ribosomal protein S17 [Planctomycetota bacterium]